MHFSNFGVLSMLATTTFGVAVAPQGGSGDAAAATDEASFADGFPLPPPLPASWRSVTIRFNKRPDEADVA